MKLCRLVFEQHYINQWGHKEMSGRTYRVIDVVDVWENEETLMVNNGYEPPYPCPVFEANDGRTWLRVQNRIDYWGGVSWRPLFDQVKVYESDSNVSAMTKWVPYEEAAKMQLVNEDLRPVDIEGNVL
jgi:hypothetical protein